ncbi:MAG: hypothetical protein ACI9Z3_002197 [Roseivirga sp.]|jgi:hypothetical protein
MIQRIVNMAYYHPKDWSHLLSIVDDKEVFHETWEEWHKQYLITKRHLESEGLKVSDVVVEIDELISFCFRRGIKNDAKARSHFVSLINK